MQILNGTQLAKEMEEEMRQKLVIDPDLPPCLAVILVGDDPASKVYVGMKKKKCAEVGIRSIAHELSADCSQEDLLQVIHDCNSDPAVHGILVQFPLPGHIDKQVIMESVSPDKDVDGFHPVNMGKLLLGRNDGFVPCTPLGIQPDFLHEK